MGTKIEPKVMKKSASKSKETLTFVEAAIMSGRFFTFPSVSSHLSSILVPIVRISVNSLFQGYTQEGGLVGSESGTPFLPLGLHLRSRSRAQGANNGG